MIPSLGRLKPVAVWRPVVLAMVLFSVWLQGCGSTEPPLSPAAQVFKQEVRQLLGRLEQSLAEPIAAGRIAAINTILQAAAQTTADICLNCPYRLGVLNEKGDLLTTYPKNDLIGLNFAAYRGILASLQKQRISQAQAFAADGTKMYFISAPVRQNNRLSGVIVLTITPADLNRKWNLTEAEFFAIDFNKP